MKFFMLHIANIQKKNYRKNKKLRKSNIGMIKSVKKN